jgi:hypothetical protein
LIPDLSQYQTIEIDFYTNLVFIKRNEFDFSYNDPRDDSVIDLTRFANCEDIFVTN